MSTRAKRQKKTVGVYHDAVPLDNDYDVIHASEARRRRIGNETRSARTERSALPDATQWNKTTTWVTHDDPEYALDPDGARYDEAVEAELGENDSTPILPASAKKKNISKVSKRPHLVWKELHRQTYLDEITRWDGRGDFAYVESCIDCLSRKAALPGVPEYRCRDCFLPDLLCATCCMKRHRHHPFHRIQKWNGNRFLHASLKDIGLKIQLNHSGMYCENPIACHAQLLVLHTNGIHDIAIQYCGCSRAIPQHLQLLRRGLYPASQLSVQTCATFSLLRHLHILALTTKASTYDFYRGLEKMTDNTGLRRPRSRYRALFRMILQWRHLKMLKWGGRANAIDGVSGTKPGELAIRCPSCPWPDINLPSGWEDVAVGMRFLYMMIVCMDANFRLKNQIVSNYSQDPGLGTGWAYMIEREQYEKYCLSRASEPDISTCVGLQALAKANTKFSFGLRYTGVGAVSCGRSEMILPQGVGNLQKGERYANMDYICGSALRGLQLLLLLISYDIMCQWFINLFKRMEEHWPQDIRIPSTIKIIPAIPKLHEPMHEVAGHEIYSFNFIPGVGETDGECPERIWAPHNILGNSTKTQGPGSRQDVLDDHFNFWNWQKFIGTGLSLARKYKAAVAERNIQVEGHRGLTESVDKDLVAKWETMCVEWEEDEFPKKKKKNPYQTEGAGLTEAQAKKNLAQEEEARLAEGGISLHATTPPAFISLGLELEDAQRRIRRLVKEGGHRITDSKEASLAEERSNLRVRLRGWDLLLPIYMPGLLQYRTDLLARNSPTPTSADNPEDVPLWLPSEIPGADRSRVCAPSLATIEDKLRTAQCNDALDSGRRTLRLKARMIAFKHKNVRGQKSGTRSRSVIDRVHRKVWIAADKYRAARRAKLALVGPGNWEESLRVLEDGDLRSYQDPNRLRPRRARPGILDDEELARAEEQEAQAEAAGQGVGTEANFSLFREARQKRDGTGETRRTLSWIWMSTTPLSDDDNDEILRTEWAKSRVRAARFTEEVMLLKEEMRRVLAFLVWKANVWRERGSTARGEPEEMEEGKRAFALGQADLQDRLADRFRVLWKASLDTMTTQDEGGDDENEGDKDQDNVEDWDDEDEGILERDTFAVDPDDVDNE